ncbi:MAG: endonuclease/exonuclease/phosphatase family protein [Prevotella sp.]|nr:endonuclease/exonuclease/phosphatase family protein [Bacteroides sp.]MCM1366386.1 endonuclease/exonuclease/phosphatase family protein [Prevotella sp.]MCM1436685.1 endonuclease/exonuclease/phosphatase family protein [Prevotella sp.]
MKKLARLAVAAVALVVLCCLVTPSSVNAKSEGKKYQTFGVAFYNLENLFDTINNNGKYDLEFSPKGKRQWDGHKYWKKLEKLSYAISQMTTPVTPNGPAVIGVSEIENITVLNDLVKQKSIADWNLQVVHHDSPDRRGVDVGLLYNPKQFKLLKVTNHTLNIPDKPYFKTRDQMCVVGLMGGQRIAIIVNHWPSRYGGQEQSSPLREAAASLTKSIADSLLNIDPSMAIVVMGDLNDDPSDKSCAQVLNAKKKENEVTKGGFFNPFWQKLDDGIGSYIYRGGWDLFDQIIVNYNLLPEGASKLKFYKAEVLNKPFLLQTTGQYKGYTLRTYSGGVWMDGYSDHLPTEIYLRKVVE